MPDEILTTTIPESLAVFEQAREQINLLVDKCKDFVINSYDSLESGKALAKDAKKIETIIEDRRKEITKPILDEKKRIDDFAKSLTNSLSEGIQALRNQILNYEKEQERIRQEEIRRLEAERRAAEEELRKQMEANQEVKQEDIEKLKEIKEQQVATVTAPVQNSIRKTWTFEVVDLYVVPVQFLMIDEAKVKQAIAVGAREIPGLTIFQKESLSLR